MARTTKETIGYKGFKRTYEGKVYCRDMQYNVGLNIDKKQGNLRPCSNGIHFCKKLKDVNSYYSFKTSGHVFARVTVPKGSAVVDDFSKSVAKRIQIDEFCTFEELVKKHGTKIPAKNFPKSVIPYRNTDMFSLKYDNSNYTYKNVVNDKAISEAMRTRVIDQISGQKLTYNRRSSSKYKKREFVLRGHYYEMDGGKYFVVEKVFTLRKNSK